MFDRKEYNRKYYQANKDSMDKRSSSWQRANPASVYKYHTKRKYGLTEEEFQKLKEIKACEICNSIEKLCIDHRHSDGKVRGVLCNSCNVGIGYFKEDLTMLQNAIEYLRRANGL